MNILSIDLLTSLLTSFLDRSKILNGISSTSLSLLFAFIAASERISFKVAAHFNKLILLRFKK